MEHLEEVGAANRALLARARELNVRAGTSVFPVPGREELAKLFLVALGGARRVAEIRNMSALLLPALDEELVEKVLAESPDTISILGQEVQVEYRSGYAPRVRLDFRGEDGRNWLKLPDAGIHLPGGREVSMYSALEEGYIEANSSQFKAKARECLNEGLWSKWQKPELPAPTDFVSPIVEAEYGRCVVSDASLVAYGAVNYDSWYGSWKSYWSRDRSEIERIHAQSCAKFVEMREKVARDALKKRVGELYSTHNYNRELPEEMRSRMYNTYYGYSGGVTTVAEIKAFIAEVEVAVKAEAERKAEAEQTSGLPSNVRIWFRDGRTNAGRGWVVGQTGVDRKSDSMDTSMHSSNSKRYHQSYEGYHVWDQILAGEVVLKWSKSYSAAPHEFEVIHLPAEGLTEAQLERIREIQDELESEWEGARGLASGLPSPPVGEGWGLLPKEQSETAATADALEALRQKWGAR